MRIRFALSFAAVAASCVFSCFAQSSTPTSSQTSPPLPEMAVPVAPASPGAVPARPGYARQSGSTQSGSTQEPGVSTPTTVPAPTAAPAPVVAPATPESPYSARPAYGNNQAYVPYGIPDEDRKKDADGSTYIPVDSWVYPEMTRLYSLGYVDTMFLGMRPWTRKSVLHMLDDSEDDIMESDSEEAKEILAVMKRELRQENPQGTGERGQVYGIESVYTRVMGMTGNTLRDSYHLGQTIVNDYGRPYQPGFNSLVGFSSLAERGRFSFYVRGEYQHSPSATGYSQSVSNQLSLIDEISFSGFNKNQATIPTGPIAAQNPFRIVEATVSFHLLGHEISGGKSDAWLGPAQGGAMAWSNNAENIYSFRINRVEPLHIPFVSAVLGPMRYDFFYGSLKGHTAPNSPYTHSEMFSFRPTKNFEFGFQRTIVFGGKGHSPVTLAKFTKSFFSVSDTGPVLKFSREDPGARFSDFTASYRLPFVRKYATFYLDSIAHDDVSPISAPRRAAYRTGIYISQIPGVRKLDLRVEAANTNPGVRRSDRGSFNYYEVVQQQAYTNKGFIMGDWIGREAKGGQAWLTYHLSGNEWVQLEYLNKKTPKDFLPGKQDIATGLAQGPFVTQGPGGATQNSFKANVVKRFHHDDVEVNGWFQYERWKAPIYLSGPQSNTTTAVQITFYPELKSKPTH